MKGDFDNNKFIMNNILIFFSFMIHVLNFCEFDLILEKKY